LCLAKITISPISTGRPGGEWLRPKAEGQLYSLLQEMKKGIEDRDEDGKRE